MKGIRASQIWCWAAVLACLLAAGCAQLATPPATVVPPLAAAPPPATNTPALLPTALPTATASPQPTAVETFAVCSPLKGAALADLPGMVSNPYHPPKPGRDDPHAGVDLADRQPGSQTALAGREIDAVLAGRVAAVVRDRFPFGNALILETPLSSLPAAFQKSLALPEVSRQLAPPGPLTCPVVEIPGAWDFSSPSLYILYAHMRAAPQVQVGETVACGQEVGQVGQTGNALVPHLHLEVRVGPGGARLASLSHYDSGAAPDEMRSYCLWSVSGLFQLVDPLTLFR